MEEQPDWFDNDLISSVSNWNVQIDFALILRWLGNWIPFRIAQGKNETVGGRIVFVQTKQGVVHFRFKLTLDEKTLIHQWPIDTDTLNNIFSLTTSNRNRLDLSVRSFVHQLSLTAYPHLQLGTSNVERNRLIQSMTKNQLTLIKRQRVLTPESKEEKRRQAMNMHIASIN